jgi:capsid protein
VCDATGKLSLEDIQYMASIAIDRDGDVGLALSKTDTGYPQVQLIESHRICSDYSDEAYTDGIATDNFARIKSIKVKAGDGYRKFAANDFILIQEARRVDQLRGLSSLTPVINTLATVDELLEYESIGVKLNSSIGLVITSPEGEANDGSSFIEDGFTAADTGGLAQDSWSSGMIPRLAAGESIESFGGASGRPSATFNGFLEQLIAMLAQGLNVPAEFLYSPKGLNGASQRFIIKKAERAFTRRRNLIADKLMRRLYVWVTANAIKAGKLPNDENWYKVNFIGDAFPSIDYGRDSAQTRENIKLGITTLQDASLEVGKSWEDIRNQTYVEADNLLKLADKLANEHKISKDAALNLLSTRSLSGLPSVEEEQ